MVTKISKKNFRKLLDELNISSTLTDDGFIKVLLNADKDFGYDVVIIFDVEEDTGELTGLSSTPGHDFDIPDKDLAQAYIICNEWNRTHIINAYVSGNSFWTRYEVFNDEPVSENFIKENFIKICTAGSWQFYCSLVK